MTLQDHLDCGHGRLSILDDQPEGGELGGVGLAGCRAGLAGW